jgi:DNA-binding NarL/FixJ family response regulator
VKKRELEIIILAAQGLPDGGIARRLGVCRNTISMTLSRLYDKYGVPCKMSLVILALREGYIHLEEIPT